MNNLINTKNNNFLHNIIESCDTLYKLNELEPLINKTINILSKKILNTGKFFLCGNGGSFSDAEHICAELLVRLRPKFNRKPIPAILLGQNMSTLTACANDYNFKFIFSKNLEALGTAGKDVLIVYSTSGNSQNIIEAIKIAKKKKIFTIGFLGKNGGRAKLFTDLNLIIPSENTARIQEAHIFLSHYIFEEVENTIYRKK